MDGKLTIEDRGESITVEAWGRDSLRVRVLPKGSRQTSDWALDIPLAAEGEVETSGGDAVIRNGRISCRVSDTYVQKRRMEFCRHDGDGKKRILSEHDYAVHAHNPGTRIFRPTGDGLFHTELHLASRDGERFYGMGLNATGSVDLKGSVIDLYQRHVKHVVPFVVSSDGYGLLWNNPSLGRVEFGTNRTRWVSRGSRQLDYFVTTGDSYADIMSNYADATGHAPAFPYWASGFWQCKLRYETQEEFLEVAREFRRRGLPLAVHVIDFCHWDVLGNWRLDPRFWPDPGAMVGEMDEMGVRIMISPWVLVSPRSENFRHMNERNMFITSKDGGKDSVRFGKEDAFQYDPTNPEAARFLWSKWKQNYVDLGIRTFWLDPADDFHEIADYDRMRYHVGPATEAHCYYPVAHQKTIYEGLIAAGEREVVTINRSSWAGSQRYGAAPAHHDILSSFEHFEDYMKAYLNLGMSGIPWAATGIGGFVPREEGERFHELMIRWYQYGVFCPIFRTHGNRKNNEAWNIGGDSYRHIRAAMLLRERLRPYVMKQMKLASERGLPPMRPVFFDFEQADPNTAEIEDQFLFGPDLLVAPVTRFDVRSRDVYLPAGTDWTDAWTGKRLTGGQTVRADAPLEHIPVYVRGDAPDLLEIFAGV
ncbi:MAG: glycoside hydrolase family 31 protein [Planctomycetota bacterium]|jgi:alpha-D-xyloside xylohydrolase